MLAFPHHIIFPRRSKSLASFVRTHGCWVLAKVLGLVTTQNTSGLNLRSRAPGKLLVEVDNALHGDAIGVGANSLGKITISVSLFSGATTQNALNSSPRRGEMSSPMLFGSPHSAPPPPILRLSRGGNRVHCTYLGRSDLEVIALAHP